jgi:pyroglutamyl-peptidase
MRILRYLLIFAAVFCPVLVQGATRHVILITGFEPFGGWSVNSSWEGVKKFNKVRIKKYLVVVKQLPVSYSGSVTLLYKAIHDLKPAAVICLGMGAEGAIALEAKAKRECTSNYPDNSGDVRYRRHFRTNAPPSYNSRLPLKLIYSSLKRNGFKVRISRDAGGYVCNHVFYALVDYYSNRKATVGFIHVPPFKNGGFNVMRARQAIAIILRNVVDYLDNQK